jgi:hypothetical protein
MTVERIEHFVQPFLNQFQYVVMFIAARDYEELREKNFWRVVPASNAKQWEKTKDHKLERIFSGSLFSSLRESDINQLQ